MTKKATMQTIAPNFQKTSVSLGNCHIGTNGGEKIASILYIHDPV